MSRFLLSLLLLACALPAFAQTSNMVPVDPIAPQALAERIAAGDAPDLILDVRTREEYEAGHLPRARNIPIDDLAAELDNLKAFQHGEIVLYCRSGRRSGRAEALLREHEFTDLTQLDGSYLAWEAARLPIERSASERPE